MVQSSLCHQTNIGITLNKEFDAKIDRYKASSDDPGYLSYRCDSCGLTGNKAMTTLAQAEWLKRLVSHQREPITQMPYLQSSDVDVLLNGTGHTDQHAGGWRYDGWYQSYCYKCTCKSYCTQ